jgi:hypothetical protein
MPLSAPHCRMQGQEKAKSEGKYDGRPETKRRNARIAAMFASGTSYGDIQETSSRATVAKIGSAARRHSAPEKDQCVAAINPSDDACASLATLFQAAAHDSKSSR